jgi:hypothetical protein
MKIELRFKQGEETVTKTYVNDYISALIYKEYNKLEQKFNALEKEPTIEQYDKLIGLMCKAFDNQFTIDDFWNGSSTFSLRQTIFEFIMAVKGIPLEPTEEQKEKEKENEDKTPATP